MSDYDERLEKQYRRLRTRNPMCKACPECDPFCLELHHFAGRKHHNGLVIVCRNCHRKLTEKQKKHVPAGTRDSQGTLATIGHYLLGLADLLTMVAKTLNEFGATLLHHAHNEVTR